MAMIVRPASGSFCMNNGIFLFIAGRNTQSQVAGTISQYSPIYRKSNSITDRMLDVEAFILVGGASSRMGADKSQLILGAETTVARLRKQLGSVASQIRLVGARET